MVYVIILVRRMRAQRIYPPQPEGWLFHVLRPFAAYATLAGSAVEEVCSKANSDFFAFGAAALLLLIIGIHNAWDTITYHIYFNYDDQKRGKDTTEYRPTHNAKFLMAKTGPAWR
jgi:hypothetical protein